MLTLSTNAAADDLRDVARGQARVGKQAYESGDFKRASLKFELAYAAEKTPVIALWRARVAREQGRFSRALALYEQTLQMSRDPKCKLQARVRTAALAERNEMLSDGRSAMGPGTSASSR